MHILKDQARPQCWSWPSYLKETSYLLHFGGVQIYHLHYILLKSQNESHMHCQIAENFRRVGSVGVGMLQVFVVAGIGTCKGPIKLPTIKSGQSTKCTNRWICMSFRLRSCEYNARSPQYHTHKQWPIYKHCCDWRKAVLLSLTFTNGLDGPFLRIKLRHKGCKA